METTYDLFTDRKSVTIIELNNKRLKGIWEVNYYPLLEEWQVDQITYPTRQQLHSKRYYVTRNSDHVVTMKNANLSRAIERAQNILQQLSPYEVKI